MQNEYKRGISCWSFDVDDLKAQASLVFESIFYCTYTNNIFIYVAFDFQCERHVMLRGHNGTQVFSSTNLLVFIRLRIYLATCCEMISHMDYPLWIFVPKSKGYECKFATNILFPLFTFRFQMRKILVKVTMVGVQMRSQGLTTKETGFNISYLRKNFQSFSFKSPLAVKVQMLQDSYVDVPFGFI